MAVFISNNAASSGVAAIGARLNSGTLDLYAGSSQPANANTDTTASHYILAALPFSTVAGLAASSTWTAATTGVLSTTAATSTGIALFYRAYSSTGTVVIDGSVSSGVASDLNFNTYNIVQGVSVTVTSYSLVLPEQA